jgi:methionyl-tRNA formyltransferase
VEAALTLRPELAARRSGAADLEPLCRRYGVPVHRIGNINEPACIELLHSLDLDVLFVIGWHQILRPDALHAARTGTVGAHASVLPHNRGSAPISWTLIRGEHQGGNSLIWLREEVDAGEIIDQRTFAVTPYDTCATLYQRVAETNREMILELVQRLAIGERPGTPQPRCDEPILPRRRPEDGLIAWSEPAAAVYDFVRALTRPYPGAFTHLGGTGWRIWTAARLPFDSPAGACPGQVLGSVVSPAPEACGQLVACGTGAVVLLELEREDGTVVAGRQLSSLDWRGQRFE